MLRSNTNGCGIADDSDEVRGVENSEDGVDLDEEEPPGQTTGRKDDDGDDRVHPHAVPEDVVSATLGLQHVCNSIVAFLGGPRRVRGMIPARAPSKVCSKT